MQAVLQLTKQLSEAFTFNPATTKKDDPISASADSWWKEVIAYQVWPASFKDSNSDGLGDIPGLISKIDYLADLGVDVVWLSPMYASPQVDFGYDISDYENVYPPYGTLADMDELIKGLHSRGMKLILDLVINHTSDEHKWFIESASSRTNPKADWYTWRDGKKDSSGKLQPPNNWGSIFGGSAWEYVPARDQYYLHLFAKAQPDLNWESEAARQAIFDSALHFWFKKGVDGFRIDTANLYSKNQSFPDGPVGGRFAPYGDSESLTLNGPRIHEFYQDMRENIFSKYVGGDPMLVGELPGTNLEETLRFVSSDSKEMSMVFDFGLPGMGGMFTHAKHDVTKVTMPELKKALTLPQNLASNTKAWATVFGENHDIPRSISRIAKLSPRAKDGDVGSVPEYHERAGKVLAMLFGSLSGTLFIYQGQEIGMTNIDPTTWSLSDLKDVDSLNYYHELEKHHPGDEDLMKRAWQAICDFGRDNARTPVQWTPDAATSAGFTTEGTKPWMRLNDNYPSINVSSQLASPTSIRSFYKSMLALRKRERALFIHGRYQVLDEANEDTVMFVKHAVVQGEETGTVALVVLNFTDKDVPFVLERVPEVEGRRMEVALANLEKEERGEGLLRAWEGRVYVEVGV